MSNSIVYDRAFKFSVRIYDLYKVLNIEKKEFIISKQVLRSGTSIAANIKESIEAQSTADFVSKLNIALKEASETEYWIDLLNETKLIEKSLYDLVKAECIELIKMLKSIIKTTKQKSSSTKIS